MATVMTKYLKLGIFAALALMLGSCNEADRFDPTREVLVLDGTAETPLVKFAVETVPAVYPVTVSATGKVAEDITVSLKIDNSLVEKYNAENKTSYFETPEGSVELSKSQVVISKGSAISDVSNLTIVSDADFIDGRIYMIPVTITDVKGDLELLESSRTAYIRISRVYSFPAIDLSNTGMYASFIFEDDQVIELEAHTVEIKFLANTWHTSNSNPISRLACIADKNEKGYLLRIGENGYEKNQLQVLKSHPTLAEAKFGSNARFETNVWYTLSMTFDGSVTRLYVNGERDNEFSGGSGMSFQRVELGMSWGGYGSSQKFDGRIAEIRVWNRALSASEIQLGLCGVDPASEGLMGYWKLNEGQGAVFADATGNGRPMDWGNIWRSPDEGELKNLDYSSQVRWLFDDKNKCAN